LGETEVGRYGATLLFESGQISTDRPNIAKELLLCINSNNTRSGFAL